MNPDDIPAYIEREKSASLPSLFSPSRCANFDLTLRSMPGTAVPGILLAIRQLDDDDVFHFTHLLIAPERLPSRQFLELLSRSDCVTSLRACLLVYVVMRGRLVPRDFQLEAALESLHGCDSVVIAGTGQGKTLCIVVPLLLHPGTMSITIPPLKRLQMMQVCTWHELSGLLSLAMALFAKWLLSRKGCSLLSYAFILSGQGLCLVWYTLSGC